MDIIKPITEEEIFNNKVEITWRNVGKSQFHKENGEHVFSKDKVLAEILKIPYEPNTEADFIPPDDADADSRILMDKKRKTSLGGDERFKHKDGIVAQFMKLYGYDAKVANYRRFKLKRFFEEKLGDKYNGISDIRKMSVGHYTFMVISNSVGWRTMIDTFTWDYLIYDRTDNWGAWSQTNRAEEDELIYKADIVFNSSRWLYEDSKRKRKDKPTFLVPNGLDVKEYVPQEKYKEITGCYAGKTDNKVDWDLVKKIADTYKIKIYGEIEPQFEHENVEWCGFKPEDELQNEMAKCHFGLIPFREGEWTAAMLPLKLFHYANAHIPTVYSNCPECSYYPTIASEITMGKIDILNPTDEEYEEILKESDWQDKFNFIWKEIKNVKNGRNNAGGETNGHVSNQLEDDQLV